MHRVITGFLVEQAGLRRGAADAGAVTLVQRFGSAANLNIHLHCLVLDWVYRRTEGEPVFDEVRAPTDDELEGLLDQILARLMKMLTRTGRLVEEQGMSYLADTDADHPLASLQAASCTYRIAFGPRTGQKVLSVRTGAGRDEKTTHTVSTPMPTASACTPRVVQPASEPAHGHGHTHGQAVRMSWGLLLTRVFDIDVGRCVCGGQLKIIAAIEEPVVIVRMLAHLGLAARALPRAPARELSLNHAA